MSLVSLFFSFADRIGRGKFWLGFVVILVAELVLDWLFGVPIGGGPTTQRIRIIDFVIQLVLLYPTMAVAVKRLHDRGQAGAWAWLLLAALVVGMLADLFDYSDVNQVPLAAWIVGIAAGIVMLGFLIELGFRRGRVAAA
jgi:uncharacterized membrane protein YhaH (DUF805 family)